MINEDVALVRPRVPPSSILSHSYDCCLTNPLVPHDLPVYNSVRGCRVFLTRFSECNLDSNAPTSEWEEERFNGFPGDSSHTPSLFLDGELDP